VLFRSEQGKRASSGVASVQSKEAFDNLPNDFEFAKSG